MFNNKGSSLAYGVLIVGVFLFLATVLYILLMIPYNNQLIGVWNNFIGQGMVTDKTNSAMGFYRNVIAGMGVILLHGLTLWAIVNANESRTV